MTRGLVHVLLAASVVWAPRGGRAGAPPVGAAPENGPAHTLRGRATGVSAPVTLRVRGGPTVKIAADGPFVLPVGPSPRARYEVEVVAADPGLACEVTPSVVNAAQPAGELTLACAARARAPVTPVLPADRAVNVSPLIGKVVLVLAKPMLEPPAGTFALEAREGERWVDTGLEATAEYRPDTREWRFTLDARAFPPTRVLRAVVVPTAGKDVDGRPLARVPIRWTFTTGANPLVKSAERDGGCPVGTASDAAGTGGERDGAAAKPCDEPRR